MDEQNLVESKNFSFKALLAEQRFFVVLGLVVLAVGAVAGVGIYKVYAKTAADKFSLTVAKVLRLPAVKVGSERISYVSYVDDLRAIHIMRDYDKSQRDAGIAPD